MIRIVSASVAIPAITGILSLFLTRNRKFLYCLNVIAALFTFLQIAAVIFMDEKELRYGNLVHVDALSIFFLMIVALLGLVTILISIAYIERDVREGNISSLKAGQYFFLLQMFWGTMIALLMVDNLGMMWVLIEATTLITTLLVSFYLEKRSVEAAWKYVMVCSVGICLALLGTILLYYAQVNSLTNGNPLGWSALFEIRNSLDAGLVKLSFVFIVIGYGTKIGLAPMHTWLPDAHSQSPSPISGILSGALLSCAFYVLLRNLIILKVVLDSQYVMYILLALGFFSLIVAIPFIAKQNDIKRMLAYSSVEHMGIAAIAVGVGTKAAIYAALLHIFNHSMVKAGLFSAVGEIAACYKTKEISKIKGLFRATPGLAVVFLLLSLAILGMPPFGIFISKILVTVALLQSTNWLVAIILLLLLSAVFMGMIRYVISIVSGNPYAIEGKYEYSRFNIGIVCSLVLLSFILGVYMPETFCNKLQDAVQIVSGG